jgi:hypothetical protein
MDEDVARLSPLLHEHINMLGRYFFAIPDAVAKGVSADVNPRNFADGLSSGQNGGSPGLPRVVVT